MNVIKTFHSQKMFHVSLKWFIRQILSDAITDQSDHFEWLPSSQSDNTKDPIKCYAIASHIKILQRI